jgi:hypothetical protein
MTGLVAGRLFPESALGLAGPPSHWWRTYADSGKSLPATSPVIKDTGDRFRRLSIDTRNITYREPRSKKIATTKFVSWPSKKFNENTRFRDHAKNNTLVNFFFVNHKMARRYDSQTTIFSPEGL